MPTSASSSATRALMSALAQPAISSGSAMLSAAVRDDSRLKCWKIIPIERCASRSSRPASAEMSLLSTIDAARGRLLQPVDQPDQARLAGAGAADHAGDRAARNREVDVLQRVDAGLAAIGRIDLRDALETDHRVSVRAAGEIASSVSIFCPIASDWWAFMEAAFMHNSSLLARRGACENRSRQATESEIAASGSGGTRCTAARTIAFSGLPCNFRYLRGVGRSFPNPTPAKKIRLPGV